MHTSQVVGEASKEQPRLFLYCFVEVAGAVSPLKVNKFSFRMSGGDMTARNQGINLGQPGLHEKVCLKSGVASHFLKLQSLLDSVRTHYPVGLVHTGAPHRQNARLQYSLFSRCRGSPVIKTKCGIVQISHVNLPHIVV